MENLKNLRISNNKTQTEIANILHITQGNYGKYERGEIEPDLETLKFLADYYNVTLDFLCDRKVKNDLGPITPQQNTLFKMIMQLDNDRFYMVYGYTERLLKEMTA